MLLRANPGYFAMSSHSYNPQECPRILNEFLTYHEAIRGHSQQTIDEYFLDLRGFFRYLKVTRAGLPLEIAAPKQHLTANANKTASAEPAALIESDEPQSGSEIDSEQNHPDAGLNVTDIRDIDLPFVRTITLSEIYGYLMYLSRTLGLNDASRARKLSTLRSFFKYLTIKTHQMEENPVEGIDSLKVHKDLPRYLTLDESIQLLESVSGRNQERDYCILTLFLNCGLRISELVGLDVSDIRGDAIIVKGKGGKERTVFLNEACKLAIQDWMVVRVIQAPESEKALFVTDRRSRISRAGVHKMVKMRLLEAGLDSTRYSAHKLRHTAATLMLQNGVDVRALQEVLGHDHLNTTQIYTHVDNEDLRTAARANPLAAVHREKTEDSVEANDFSFSESEKSSLSPAHTKRKTASKNKKVE